MSDISQLTILREQAAKLRAMQEAAARLPELERQAQQEQAAEQALARAAHVQAEFDTSMAQFQELKATLDFELSNWLEQGKLIIQRRQSLGNRADALTELSRRLAYARLSAGLTSSPLGGSDAIRAEGEQILINRTGHARLMVYPDQTGPAGVLLSGIVALTGDAIITKRQPAKVSIETSNGVVTELH